MPGAEPASIDNPERSLHNTGNFAWSEVVENGSMADGYFITPQNASQVEMLPGVHRRTMGTTDEAMLCEFFIQRDAVVPPHSHMNDQVGYIIYGKMEVTIGDTSRICLPGDSYAIPGGVTHSARALVDSLAVDVFSPPRNDYRTEAR
jgi:quercetin dioxygenase-like cupin family protein